MGLTQENWHNSQILKLFWNLLKLCGIKYQ
uniref:Uncharacterized protein n=1 Tax=Anguilla anguilla TaxID=7936 RepID=A0A0E9RC94_ANGAN